MQISQNVTAESWDVTIDAESFTYTNGNGPFFIVGSFNGWRVCDEKYHVPAPQHGGCNTLQAITLHLPLNVNMIEFKVWNDRCGHDGWGRGWMEPGVNDEGFVSYPNSIYYGCSSFTRNGFGSLNVLVVRDC